MSACDFPLGVACPTMRCFYRRHIRPLVDRLVAWRPVKAEPLRRTDPCSTSVAKADFASTLDRIFGRGISNIQRYPRPSSLRRHAPTPCPRKGRCGTAASCPRGGQAGIGRRCSIQINEVARAPARRQPIREGEIAGHSYAIEAVSWPMRRCDIVHPEQAGEPWSRLSSSRPRVVRSSANARRSRFTVASSTAYWSRREANAGSRSPSLTSARHISAPTPRRA
jgi:hypothetical protein